MDSAGLALVSGFELRCQRLLYGSRRCVRRLRAFFADALAPLSIQDLAQIALQTQLFLPRSGLQHLIFKATSFTILPAHT